MKSIRIMMFIQIVLLAIFSLSLYVVIGREIYLDGLVNHYFQENYTENGKQFFIIIAEIGDRWGVACIALLVSLFFLYKRYYTKLTVLISSMLLGVGSSILIKNFIGRSRPENMIMEYGGYSFPSGHSVFAVLFYGLLVYLFWDIVKNEYNKYIMLSVAMTMGILVMLSRVYLSVHYISDVFAGAVLGIFWLLGAIAFYRKVKK